MCESFAYCPICQLPLKAICILPELHVSQCMTRGDDGDNEECVQGMNCLSTDVFHYRDFSHKLLAAYRSSAYFVPPELDIKPPLKKQKTPSKTRKRSSPRKIGTPPSEGKQSKSDSDSDEDIIKRKRPRRSLKVGDNDQCSNKTSVNKPPKRVTAASNKTSQPKSSKNRSSAPSTTETETSQQSSDITENENTVKFSREKENRASRTKAEHKLTVGNVKLNNGEKVTFTNSRTSSPLSSISVSSSATSKVEDSDIESEATIGSIKRTAVKSVSKVELQNAVLSIEKCNPSYDFQSSFSKLVNNDSTISEGSPKAHNELVGNANTNTLVLDLDCDEMVPGSVPDKELLKTLDKRKSASPTTTINSGSEYNGSVSATSGTEELDSKESDPPSSPEVVIPTSFRKPTVLSSSSDSDLPLASLACNTNTSDLNTNFNEIKSRLRGGKPLRNKTNDKIKGKEKAGKILRSPNKAPVYLNGSSLKLVSAKSEGNVSADSDSGKSSGSKDSSFFPTEEQSSQHSDSAYSAESTDRMIASSVSSTYTSSQDTPDTRSSDPSFSEKSDMCVNYKSRTKSHNTTKQDSREHSMHKTNKNVYKSLCIPSDSSSSGISQKEKLFFGGKKKSPTIMNTKPKPSLRLSDNTDNDGYQKMVKYFALPPNSTAGQLKLNKTRFEGQPALPLEGTRRAIRIANQYSDTMQNFPLVHSAQARKSEWQSLLNKMRDSCFPSDLKIDSEDSLTVASSCPSSDTSYTSTLLPLRQCPFYKRIPDTPFAVDAFQYWKIPGVKVYFLSHFHSDHYIGLKKSFSQLIYCTQITANLVRMKLRVEEKWLRILELNKPQMICGVEVTALDANHCPGSVMFLFSLMNGRNHLHVGDFRASKAMTLYSSLQRLTVSTLFLDTTYCSPQYSFPSQEEVIRKVIDIIQEKVKGHPRTLVVCGSYTIGKEKVFLGVAEAMDWHVWARPEKQRIFDCLNDARINSRLVKDPRSANVHVLPMGFIQIKPLQEHLQSCSGAFTHVIGVKPTGWELNSKSRNFKVNSVNNITIYGVPYSEHSSFTELRDFVQFLQPNEVVPTVNMGSADSRGKMSKHFSDWLKPSGATQKKVSQYFKTSSS